MTKIRPKTNRAVFLVFILIITLALPVGVFAALPEVFDESNEKLMVENDLQSKPNENRAKLLDYQTLINQTRSLSGSTVENTDGSFTYTHTVNEYSPSKYYQKPSNGGGFGVYSFFNQDYGWLHNFTDWNIEGLVINSAKLIVYAWDIDSEVNHGWNGEYDSISVDGGLLNPGYLQGTNNSWSTTYFDIPHNSFLDDGKMNMWINIDVHNEERTWATELEYSKLVINYEVQETNNPPERPQLSSGGITTSDNNLTVNVVGPANPDIDGDSVTYEYRWFVNMGNGFFVDDEFAKRGNHTGNTVPYAATLPGDEWRVQVTPIDEHGSSGIFSVQTWTVVHANRPPVLNSIGNKTVSEGSRLQFAVRGTDADGNTLTYKAFNIPAGATFNSTTGIFTWTPNYGQAGIYNPIRFEVSDGEYIDKEEISITVKNTNRAPVLNYIGNKTVAEGSKLQFTVKGTDADGDTLTYRVTNPPTGASINSTTGVFTWTPNYLQAGTYYSINFEVSDGTTSDKELIKISVNNVNRSPVLDSIGNKTVSEGSQLRFTVKGTDADGDALTYSDTNLPAGAMFNPTTGIFTWTPNYSQAGTYSSVAFEVSDGKVIDKEVITITVNDTNLSPILSYIGNKTVSEGSQLKFTVKGTDADGNTLTYRAVNLPTGASFTSNGLFTWVPNYEQAGTYNSISFEVSDGKLIDKELVTITVNNTNRAPVLNSVGNKTIAENSQMKLTLNGSDADGDILTYKATNLPVGALFNSVTGIFTWKPNYEQAGAYNSIGFEVSDGKLTYKEIIVITVNNTNRAPVLGSVGSKTVAENNYVQFTIKGTDADGDTLTRRATNLPAGALFNTTTGLFSWKPSYEQAGTYNSISFEVSDGELVDKELISITVNNTNRAPVLGSVGSKTVAENSYVQFTVKGTDADGDTLTRRATNLPAGALFNTTTGLFTWKPSYEQAGTYNSISFEVSDGELVDRELISITVNNTNRAPVLGSVGSKTVAENSYVRFTVKGADADGEALTYKATNLPAGASFNRTTGLFSWKPNYEQAGTYNSISFEVSDGELVDKELISITVNNTNRAPVLDVVGNKNIDENSQIQFAIKGTDADGEALTYRATNLPTGASFNAATGIFTWKPNYEQAGTYNSISFEVSDGKLIDKELITITVNNINRPPVLNSIGNKIASEGSELQFTIKGIDVDGDNLVYKATNLPSGASLNVTTGAFTWIPNYEQSGIYSLIGFEASDGEYVAKETIKITVNHVNRRPALDNVGDKTVDENSMLKFTVTGSDPDRDVLSYEGLSLPEGAVFDKANAEFTWTPNYEQSGIYEMSFEISDGEYVAKEAIKITVNHVNRRPELDSVGDKTVDENSMLKFTVTGSDPDRDVLSYEALSLPEGAIFDKANAEFTWTPNYEQSDIYEMSFEVSDGEYVDKEEIKITVNHVNRRPELDSVGDKTVDENSMLKFTVTGSDPDRDVLSYEGLSLPEGAIFDKANAEFTWTPNYEQSGIYEMSFEVSDGEYVDKEEIKITVNHVNRRPELDSVGDKTVDENSMLKFTVTGSDPDRDVLSYEAVSLPEGAVFDKANAEFAWTPNYEQSGIYKMGFEVSDGEYVTEETIKITVNHVNRRPELDSVGDKTVDENSMLKFTVTGSDPDRDTLTFKAMDLPSGAVFDKENAEFTWIPNYEQSGIYEMSFEVSDGEYVAKETIKIKVKHVNRRPVLDSVGDKTVDENSMLEFTVTGSDRDRDVLSYKALSLPAGAVFDEANAEFTWIPNYEQSGIYEMSFEVSDGEYVDKEDIKITVIHVNRRPVLDSVGDKTVDENSMLKFTVTGSDPDRDTLTFKAIDLPSGAVLNSESGVFEWIPNYEQSGVYEVSIIVSDGEYIDKEDIKITVIHVNRNPIVDQAVASKAFLWSPNHKYQDINILGVIDPDRDMFTIKILKITSDESTVTLKGAGGKTHGPDAYGVGTDTAYVRAERSGTSNGRVYEITFVATDVCGAQTIGTVKVCVPHDTENSNPDAIDDGQLYDATIEN